MIIKKNALFNVFIIIIFSFSYAQDLLPRSAKNNQIVHRKGYSLSYSETHEQPDWVYYELTSAEVNGNYPRKDNFREDLSIFTGSASLKDYKGSGFDRGHLAPAADMKWSQQAMSESFLMSNMSPQNPGFNRGIWKRLESQVRQWALENGSIHIVTGGVLTSSSDFIGFNKVAVPKFYYKIVLDYNSTDMKGIGFLMPNNKSSKPIQNYVVSIDKVEEVTGIDFFYKLPDNIEDKIENKSDISKWSFKLKKLSENKNFSSLRCIGITKNGAQCKRKTKNRNRYCYQHQNQIN